MYSALNKGPISLQVNLVGMESDGKEAWCLAWNTDEESTRVIDSSKSSIVPS